MEGHADTLILLTPREHEEAAQRLLEQQSEATAVLPDVLAAAQVHATLAVAGQIAEANARQLIEVIH